MIFRSKRACRYREHGRQSIWAMLPPLAAFCLVTPAVLAASPERLQETFHQLDSDSDGQVTATEFDNKKIYVFGLHDANGDNAVQHDEVDLDANQFQMMDEDGDGRISGFEFIEAPIGQFRTYDTDGNDSLTVDEFMNAARPSASEP